MRNICVTTFTAVMREGPRAVLLVGTGAILGGCGDSVAGGVVENSSILSQALTDTSTWVHVPGALVDPSCVHEVPNGTEIRESGDLALNGSVFAHYRPCPHAAIRTGGLGQTVPRSPPPGPSGGWVEAVGYHAPPGSSYSEVDSNLEVPHPPINRADGQVIFLFPALQPEDRAMIMQPVLQWGATNPTGPDGPIGNWSSWTYASWIGGGDGLAGNFFHSPGITVNWGDALSGYMVEEGPYNGLLYWSVTVQDGTTGAEQVISYAFSQTILWTYVDLAALEAYKVVQCGDFPASSMTFITPSVYDQNHNLVSVPWGVCAPPSCIISPAYSGPSCSFGITEGNYGFWSIDF